MRKKARNVDPRLPVLFEFEGTPHQRPGITLSNFDATLPCQRLAVVSGQHRLGVERIYVADPAAHE